MNFSERFDLDNLFEYTPKSFSIDLAIFNEIIEYVKSNDYHHIDELLDEDENIFMVFDYLNTRTSNTNMIGITMSDLSPILDLYERLIQVFDKEEDILSLITGKMHILFKMRNNDQAEACMLEYIKNNPDDGGAYLELMFALDAYAKDTESAIYYGNLALERDTITDREAIEEFIEDLE